MRVRDVMPDELVYVRPDDSVRAAAERLAEYKHRALPVVTADGKLAGIISELDLLALLLPDYLADMEDLSFLPPDFTPGHHSFEEVACLPVSKAMRAKVMQTTTEDEPILDVIRQMTQHRIAHVPVLRDGRVIGLLSSGLLVRRLIQEARENCD
ncbi:MAG: CBS domain-containing protein [Armatimonadia bacterium]